ncbi:3-keto-steroid reductase/17-beta-hydroxysteroid dehydrogenase 7-like [Zophobas morio]|uniref:3-keto-steroid reductase/17-beta-hydroxysteroid dehydrogenase 7-like n=1 Tax=Zophobas morio TaxID=2755281 RepID=UPI00308342D9
MEQLAIITGANTGIGFALAQRLLEESAESKICLNICLSCRNYDKAVRAKSLLLSKYNCSANQIFIETVDTSSIQSVLKFTKAIKEKFFKIDYFYLNAGIMPVSKVDFSLFFTFNLFYVIKILTTGCDILKQLDEDTQDGMKSVFQTNVFGHIIMIFELLEILCKSQSKVIFTGSSAAREDSFSIDDIEHRFGADPYGSSKFLLDVLVIELNRLFNSKGVYFYTCCPGLVMSQVTYNLMPYWVWNLILVPIIRLVRMFSSFYTLDPLNGAEALLYLSMIRKCDQRERPSVFGG